jgi:NADPH:quinone reductase-like Zn-dependent oxidoreductase
MNNTRPLSVAYLVFGLLFLGTFGIWALVSARLITNLNPDWMAPVLLIGAGGVGLVALLVGSMRGAHDDAVTASSSPQSPSVTPTQVDAVGEDPTITIETAATDSDKEPTK